MNKKCETVSVGRSGQGPWAFLHSMAMFAMMVGPAFCEMRFAVDGRAVCFFARHIRICFGSFDDWASVRGLLEDPWTVACHFGPVCLLDAVWGCLRQHVHVRQS